MHVVQVPAASSALVVAVDTAQGGHIVRRWRRWWHGQRLLLLLELLMLAAYVHVCCCRRRCRKLNGCCGLVRWRCRCAGWCVCALTGTVQVAGHRVVRYLLKQPAVGCGIDRRGWLVLRAVLLLLLLVLQVVMLLLMHVAAVARRYGTCWV